MVGVTPSTVLMASRLQPSSATICSFVNEVRGYHMRVSRTFAAGLCWLITWCDQVCTAISWPFMYSSTKTLGRSMMREPTAKNVARRSFSSKKLRRFWAAPHKLDPVQTES